MNHLKYAIFSHVVSLHKTKTKNQRNRETHIYLLRQLQQLAVVAAESMEQSLFFVLSVFSWNFFFFNDIWQSFPPKNLSTRLQGAN